VEKDTRLVHVLNLISRIFGDRSLTRKQAREILQEIRDDVDIRMDALDQDERNQIDDSFQLGDAD
jgi:hypothetical protein